MTKEIRKLRNEAKRRHVRVLRYRKSKVDMWYMVGIIDKGMFYETVTVSVNRNGQVTRNFVASSNASDIDAAKIHVKERAEIKRTKGYRDIIEDNHPSLDEEIEHYELIKREVKKFSDAYTDWEKATNAVRDLGKAIGEHYDMSIVACVDNEGVEDDFTLGAEYVADDSQEVDGIIAVYGNRGILKEVFRERFDFQIESIPRARSQVKTPRDITKERKNERESA